MESRTGTGHWYKSGRGRVAIRGVFVRDTTGTHRYEYFFTTDVGLSVSAVLAAYFGRWNIEPSFKRYVRNWAWRRHGWREKTLLRVAPCLFVWYKVVAILFPTRPESKRIGAAEWPGKTGTTFSDALASVRRGWGPSHFCLRPVKPWAWKYFRRPSRNSCLPRSHPPHARHRFGISRAERRVWISRCETTRSGYGAAPTTKRGENLRILLLTVSHTNKSRLPSRWAKFRKHA